MQSCRYMLASLCLCLPSSGLSSIDVHRARRVADPEIVRGCTGPVTHLGRRLSVRRPPRRYPTLFQALTARASAEVCSATLSCSCRNAADAPAARTALPAVPGNGTFRSGFVGSQPTAALKDSDHPDGTSRDAYTRIGHNCCCSSSMGRQFEESKAHAKHVPPGCPYISD